jgi:uncharacterized membrane protein
MENMNGEIIEVSIDPSKLSVSSRYVLISIHSIDLIGTSEEISIRGNISAVDLLNSTKEDIRNALEPVSSSAQGISEHGGVVFLAEERAKIKSLIEKGLDPNKPLSAKHVWARVAPSETPERCIDRSVGFLRTQGNVYIRDRLVYL